MDGRDGALRRDAIERTRTKRNRSARPTRIGGFAKGARLEIKKATTLVAAQDNLSAFSSRTSSPSSLLASVDHLLLATHCRLYRHTHVLDVNSADRKELKRSLAEL